MENQILNEACGIQTIAILMSDLLYVILFKLCSNTKEKVIGRKTYDFRKIYIFVQHLLYMHQDK